jgi:hypothetical protein
MKDRPDHAHNLIALDVGELDLVSWAQRRRSQDARWSAGLKVTDGPGLAPGTVRSVRELVGRDQQLTQRCLPRPWARHGPRVRSWAAG